MKNRYDRSVLYIFGLQFLLLITLISFCFVSFKVRKYDVMLLLISVILCILQGICLYLFFFQKLPLRRARLAKKIYGEEEIPSKGTFSKHPLDDFDELLTKLETEDHNPYKIKMLQMQAEFQALQKQISPHFLYNTLETIRSKAFDCGSTDIMNIVESLAMLFRFRINRTGEMATFNEELNYIHHYMTINQYRFGDLYRMNVDYDEEDVRDCLLPVLTLEPLVENAILRGLEHKEGGGEINIKVTATQTRMIISVSDNGIGMEPDVLEKLQNSLYHPRPYSTGPDSSQPELGTLENLHQRIQYYFGSGYGLHISSTPGVGTIVDVMLPRM